jgi:N-methylhydantoinase A
VPLADGPFDPQQTLARFAERYKERFDIELGEMRAMLTNLRTTVLGLRPKISMSLFAPKPAAGRAEPRTVRPVFFGDAWFDTPVWRRETLSPGTELPGPAIVEQMDATTVVPPAARFRIDDFGNLIIDVGTSDKGASA